MAKRKYVKENNLVKAINTDSLELQKPLVNEYYDINIHNSNMDKIDTGYKQNKNDISNINYELSKTENTKYSTENGVKEFSCKDGYVDNVAIEGKTLVNLVDSKVDVAASSNEAFIWLVSEDMKKRVTNGTYTLVNLSNKNVVFDIRHIDTNSYSSDCNVNMSSKVITIDDTVGVRNFYGLLTDGWENTDASKLELKQSVIILEGDHTDKPISYFEGLKSVGQGDKIEVLTRNSNETKQDKKQISTTLRSLPNGVKDAIEKRGNGYILVKRCGEIILNNHNSFTFMRTDINTSRFYTPSPSDMKFINNSTVLGICDKFIYRKDSENGTDSEAIWNNASNIYITIAKSKLETQDVEGFKTWLASNPITIVYELATPQIIELPNFNPQTYEGDTTLLLNTGAIQGECEFEVTNSIGSEIEVLKDKVSSLDGYESGYEYSNEIICLNGTYKPSWAEAPYIVRIGRICILHCVLANDAPEYGLPLIKLPSFALPKQYHRYFGRGKGNDSGTLLLMDYDIDVNGILYFKIDGSQVGKLNQLYIHAIWEVE